MAQTVVGVFDSHRQAVEAVHALHEAGFHGEQISLFAPDPTEAGQYADELGIKVVQAGGVGVAAGGALGAVAGLLAGFTGLLIPGVGPLLAAGPIAGALVGLVGGATTGGLLGLLVGVGLPHDAAEEYQRLLQEGRTLVFVHPEGELVGAETALHRAEPVGLHHYGHYIGRPDELPANA